MSGTVEVFHAPTLTAIYLHGDIDLTVSADLRAALVQALGRRRRGRRLLVDLTDATGLDPIGVGALLAARDAARDARAVFLLRAPDPGLAPGLA
jgi:anti-anti-sigma regulatory factor